MFYGFFCNWLTIHERKATLQTQNTGAGSAELITQSSLFWRTHCPSPTTTPLQCPLLLEPEASPVSHVQSRRGRGSKRAPAFCTGLCGDGYSEGVFPWLPAPASPHAVAGLAAGGTAAPPGPADRPPAEMGAAPPGSGASRPAAARQERPRPGTLAAGFSPFAARSKPAPAASGRQGRRQRRQLASAEARPRVRTKTARSRPPYSPLLRRSPPPAPPPASRLSTRATRPCGRALPAGKRTRVRCLNRPGVKRRPCGLFVPAPPRPALPRACATCAVSLAAVLVFGTTACVRPRSRSAGGGREGPLAAGGRAAVAAGWLRRCPAQPRERTGPT